MRTTVVNINDGVPRLRSLRTLLLPSARGWRRLALLGTLIAIVWQVENWRGRKAWEAVLHETEANGQTLDWRTLVPDKVPDELNAAKHPVFEKAYWDAPSLEPYGYFLDPRPLFDQLLEGTPAQLTPDVLSESAPVTALLSELGEAFDRPHCQWFHTDETHDDGTFPVPQVAYFVSDFRKVERLINVRVVAHLEAGNSDRARQELGVLIGLGKMMKDGPFFFDQFLTASTASAVVESLGPVLTVPAWDPSDLLALQKKFQDLRLLDGMWKSFYRDKLFTYHLLKSFSELDNGERVLYQEINYMPDGWLYQNLCNVHRYWEQQLLSPFDPRTRRVIPDNLSKEVRHGGKSPRPYHYLAEIALPQVDSDLWKKLAITQTQWDLLAVLCQVQANKLIHGQYPRSLDGLEPLPHDYVTGKPPHYERRNDGTIALASLDWNTSGDPSAFEVRYELP